MSTFIDTSSGSPTYVSPSFSDVWSAAGGKNEFNPNKDISGGGSAAVNYIMQQNQNAYELELWNLKNQYDNPASQMARYQKAGLNPNLIYSQQNTSGPTSSSAPIAAKPTNFRAQNAINTLGAVSQFLRSTVDVMQGMRDVYQFAKYGETYLEQQNRIARTNADVAEFAAPYRNAQAAALGWYFGNGIPWNSPYMRSVEQGIRSGAASEGLTKANTFLARTNEILSRSRIGESVANALKIDAETGRIYVDSRRLEAEIRRINKDTEVRDWMLKYMYPADLQLKEQQWHMNKWNQDFIQPYIMRNWELRNDMLKFQMPFRGLDTGDPFTDNVFGYGFTNFLKNLRF